MKSKLLTATLFFIVFIFASCNKDTLDSDPEEQACDNGIFVGSVSLRTQQDVNEFGALCYTKIDGTLTIIDLNETEDKIVDLSPLINLREIYTETYPDSLYGSFHFRTSLLTNFEGLNSLEKVGRLVIQENENLVSLNGLESLATIGTQNEVGLLNELFIKNNVMLQNLDGLNNLVEVGFGTNMTRVNIWGNPVLENIDGLESLASIHSSEPIFGQGLTGNLWINGNSQLTNINGLSNLTNMHGGNVSFMYVGDLIGADGCATVVGNASLIDFCGLQNIVTNGNYNYLITGSGNSNCYDGYGPTAQDIIDGNCTL